MLLASLELAVAALRGRLSWSDPQVRDAARATAEAIAGRGPRRVVDRVARDHLAATGYREALILRPQVNARAAIDGRERLEAARAAGRGVLVSYPHWGPYAGLSGAAAAVAGEAYVVAGAWF